MAYVDDLTTIRDNLVGELKNETTRRLALTAAGHPPPTTYSVGGRNVDWNGYLGVMVARIKEMDDLLGGAEEPFELPMSGYS